MIPALLSAVYVVYLYHKLNAPSAESSATGTTAVHDPDQIERRMAALQERIERLARTQEPS